MKLWPLATVLLTGCSTNYTVKPLPTPPERMACEAAGPRPKIAPEPQINWAKIVSIAEAEAAHGRVLTAIHAREGVVAKYLLDVEGRLFVCATNMQWRRTYEAGVSNGN